MICQEKNIKTNGIAPAGHIKSDADGRSPYIIKFPEDIVKTP